MDQNFYQNMNIESKDTTADPKKAGTWLAASSSFVLAYFVWNYPYLFVLLICGAIIASVFYNIVS